jgi:hypothetical protein
MAQRVGEYSVESTSLTGLFSIICIIRLKKEPAGIIVLDALL